MLSPEAAVEELKRMGLDFTVVRSSLPQERRGLQGVEAPEVGRVAVAVPDHTRPVPLRQVLAALSPLLGDRSLLIFATGTHPMTMEDAARMLGEWAVRARFKVHDCLEPHAYVGSTARGLAVEVDEGFASADFRATVGVVAPHPWAGFSGGGKVVLPGLSSLETILEHHLKWYKEGRPGVVEGNPFREEVEEAARLAGVDWSLNLVVSEGGEVIYAAWGDPWISFKSCVEVAERMYVKRIDSLYDSALVFAEPLDLDLYQATKALEMSAPAVAEGGSIVLVAKCPRGYGSREFEEFAGMDSEEVVKRLEGGYAGAGNLVPAIVAIKVMEVAERHEVALLTEANFSGLKGVRILRSPSEALQALKGRVLVVEKGGFTIPMRSSLES